MSQDDLTPRSIEAEQAVLGALLMDNDAFDRMGDLRSEHFYRGDHRAIFAEILKQLSAGKSCDVISVFEVLGKQVDDCLVYLNQLVQTTMSSASIARHAASVRDKAVKRALIGFGADIQDNTLAAHEDASVLVDRASSKLEELAQTRIRNDPRRAGECLAEHMDEIEARLNGTSKAISTGYPDIDAKLSGGFREGCLYVLAGRPKMGKTALALNIGLHVAKDHGVLFESMEMPIRELNDRNLAVEGHIALDNLMAPSQMSNDDWANVTKASSKINDLKLFLAEQPAMRILDVRMKAKHHKRKHGLKLLILDYLQLMEGDGESRNEQIGGITRGLKGLAKELGIAIIALSQLNRDLEKRPNKRPQPSDLRDSGAIEQDADAVIFVYRDEVYNPDSPDRGVCEVDVALCRQGAPGRCGLTYIAEQTRFESMARSWQPQAPVHERARKGLALALQKQI
jgi:replicative DNA helicase